MSTLPVTILTGFLGSGKTTLLSHLLTQPQLGDAAVIINEFGEIGLDHMLVRHVDEGMVVLNSGCLCCTIRSDLVDAMRDLFLKRVKGEVPEFTRLVIETTGLADPAPILHTLISDPVVSSRYRLDGIVACIDAIHGLDQLERHPEALKQAAVADRLVLTKTDLAHPEMVAQVTARLKALNPGAPVIPAIAGCLDPATILDAGLFNAKSKIPDVAAWLNHEAYSDDLSEGHHSEGHHHHHDVNRHDARISAFVLTFDDRLDWPSLAMALDLLAQAKGESLLRVKGILALKGHDLPVALHGIQHMFHPPAPLPAWPRHEDGSDDCRSRIVFITRDLTQAGVEDILRNVLVQ